MDKRTVLIVENDLEVQSYLVDLLHGLGWSVLLETEGKSALKTFRNSRVDVVLLDAFLPVTNGFQVAEALRATPKGFKVPIIMLSGLYDGEAEREEVIDRFGLLGYLNKPIQGKMLRELLEECFYERGRAEIEVEDEKKRRKDGRQTARRMKYGREWDDKGSALYARKVGAVGVPLRGSLQVTDFPFVMGEIARIQATGAVYILGEKAKKIVHFHNGVPVFVKSNLLRECLGRMLVTEGFINEEHCEESLQRMKISGRMQGLELMEMGVLGPDQLVDGLRRQMEINLLGIFALERGKYIFKENVQSAPNEFRSESTVATVIYKGVTAMTPPARIERFVSEHLRHYPAPSENPIKRFQVMDTQRDDERYFLDDIDGGRPVGALLKDAIIEPQRAGAILYSAHASGMIELWDGPVEKGRLEHSFGVMSGRDFELMSEKALLNHLSEKLVSIQHGDYYDILELDHDAGLSDLEQAFTDSASQYHPDRFVHYGIGSQELAESLFDVYCEAYRVLKSSRQEERGKMGRREWGRIEEKLKTSALDMAARALDAARNLDEGLFFEAENNWAKAVEKYRRAVAAKPHRWDLRTRLGWALMNSSPDNQAVEVEAEDELKKAVRLNPGAYQPHLYLGYLLENRKDLDGARKEYLKALHIDPRAGEADTALRRLGE